MKHRLLALVAFLSFSAALIAGNNTGIEFYKAGMYDAAKQSFLQQSDLSADDQVVMHYYMGLIFSKEQNAASAALEFQKATELAPKSPYGYIGQARLVLATDAKAGEALLKQAEGLGGKKNAEVLVQIAAAYAANSMFAKAQAALDKAKVANQKFVDAYLLEGDMILQQYGVTSEAIGKAIQKYEDADFFSDNTSKLALVKLAKLYNLMQAQALAMEKINKALALDSNYLPAYIALGDVKYEQSWYKDAITAYEKVITAVPVPVEVSENYAKALYFDKQYQKSLDEIQKVLQQKPDNATLHRLEAYNLYELGQYQEGLQKMQAFMASIPVDKQIYLDFITLGRFNAKLKNFDAAIANFNKAMTLDPSQADTFKELALVFAAQKQYDESIAMFEKYFSLTPAVLPSALISFAEVNKNAAIALFVANRDNAKALIANQAQFDTYIETGAQAYSKFIELAPELQAGWMGRANIYALVDAYQKEITGTHGGVARPYYDEALNFMLNNNADGRYNSDIIDSYFYIAGYYIINNNTKSAVEYYKKILAIDPKNAEVLKILKQLNIKV
ncbi:MAG: hypothetical protein LBU90_01010 [Bacteroidales bacterium]|jgi:tetratricopeptide (TPR) repeat protein|nr:hypothetical protein [Bacteroidales bacterium]